MVKKSIYILMMMTLMVSSCKTKSAAAKKGATRSMSANKIIKTHYDKSFKQKTLIAKMKVKYKGKSNLPSVTASLRMEKDKTIWISLSKIGFPIGKVLITKDKVSYYEKINRTYFEGDFALLSNWLGTELDFEKVQNLILGEPIFNLKKERHLAEANENNYELTPKRPYELFDIFYFINNVNFKLDRQQVNQLNEEKQLTVDYGDYEKIGAEIFPKKMVITAQDYKLTTTVNIEYRSIQFNKSVFFPFSIPEGYKEITLK